MPGNIELVRSWIQAVNLGRLEEQVTLAHPEFEMTEHSSLPGAANVTGPEELRSYGYGWARNWSEWEWREEELIELPPDRVVLDSTLRLRGLRSSIWVEHRWAYRFSIRDGLILRMDGFQTKEEILGAAEPSTRNTATATSQQNVEVVRDAFPALEHGGVDAAAAYWHPEINWRAMEGAPDDVGEMNGVEAARRYVQDWYDMFDSFTSEVEEVLDVGGDQVVAVIHNAGRASRSGVPAELRYVALYTIRDGKIARVREYAERQEALDAVGSAE